jgi:hypothetical protein
VRSDSAPATVLAVTQRPASLLTTAQQINLRAFLSGPTRESRPGKTGDSNPPQRTGRRIDKSVAARLARPHPPRAGEVPPLSLPLTAGPMPTRPIPPPSRAATGGPEVPSPQELARSRAENWERLLVVEETAMHGQLLVPREKQDALQAQLVEARRAVARERDILDAARRDIERTTGRPLLPLEIRWRPEKVPVHTVEEVRSPTTSPGLNSETIVAGREEPKTLARYPTSCSWAVQVPYAYLI